MIKKSLEILLKGGVGLLIFGGVITAGSFIITKNFSNPVFVYGGVWATTGGIALLILHSVVYFVIAITSCAVQGVGKLFNRKVKKDGCEK